MEASLGEPVGFNTIEALEERLSRPTPALVRSMRDLDGDVMILGAGGKMGPTLALLARRGMLEAGTGRRVLAVSRFSNVEEAHKLEEAGIETIACDLMDDRALLDLPEVPNLIYMVGTKFGATGNEPRTWAINAYLPGRVVQKFRRSRMVVFSSGNVYAFAPVWHGGSTEAASPGPVGEYAQSVLGRERVFAYFAEQLGVPSVIFRLNYAVEMRYGVLLDIASKVWAGEPIDVSMGHVNVIWQGDANAFALQSLLLAQSPPRVLNVTGPEVVSVRAVARQFGELLGRHPVLEGVEQEDALLSNAQQAFALFSYPTVPLGQVIQWVASWVAGGGTVLGKPTKFQVRDGRF